MTMFEQNLSLYTVLQTTSVQKFNSSSHDRRGSLTERLPSISEHHMFSLPEANNSNNDLLKNNRSLNNDTTSSPSLVHLSSTSYNDNDSQGDDDDIFNNLLHSRTIKHNKEGNTCASLPSDASDISALLSKLCLNFDASPYSNHFNKQPEEHNSNTQQPQQHCQQKQLNNDDAGKLTSKTSVRYCNETREGSANNSHIKLNRSISEPYKNGSNNQKSLKEGTSYCRYKTELCRPYEENGSCKYGDKCQFAHGKHELRSLVRHPKYKTDLCKTYHTTGLCPYGPRCHFIHNDEERRLNLISKLFSEHKALLELQSSQLLRQRLVAVQKLQMIRECNSAALSSATGSSRNGSCFGRQMSLDTAMDKQLPMLLGLQSCTTNPSMPSTFQCQQMQGQLTIDSNVSSANASLPSNAINSSAALSLIDQLIYKQQLQKLQQTLQQQQQQEQHQSHPYLSYNNSLDSTSPSASSSITDSPTPSPTMLDDYQQLQQQLPYLQPHKNTEDSLFLKTVLENILKSSTATMSV